MCKWGVPRLTTPSQQTQAAAPWKGETINSRQTPGTAQAPESSAEEGHGGSMPQNSPWLTQHRENTELRTSWTARRSSQSLLKEINPEYSPEELMLKRRLQHFGHLMRRADSLEKTRMLGKIKGRRRRG